MQTTQANFGLRSWMPKKVRSKPTKYGAQYEGLVAMQPQPVNNVVFKTLHEQKQVSESNDANPMLTTRTSGTYATTGKKLICRSLYAQQKNLYYKNRRLKHRLNYAQLQPS